MIQHVVLVNFRPDTPTDTRHECVRRLRELAELVPGLNEWRVGLNLTDLNRSWDMALTGQFESLDDVFAYRAHPAHRKAQKFVDENAAETVGVDFDPCAL